MKNKWDDIFEHNETEIKGFFNEYRFLSNLWECEVEYEGQKYKSVENAYQAAKYKPEERRYFVSCTPKESAKYVKINPKTNYSDEEWGIAKVSIMRSLLIQKYDPELNPMLNRLLKETSGKNLEETNYWGDTFWGVAKSGKNEIGEGKNTLGKLLMEERSKHL